MAVGSIVVVDAFDARRVELALLGEGLDPFEQLGGRDKCTVGHLRELGKDVDVSPREGLGGLKTDSMDAVGSARRPVTSGDIKQMFAVASIKGEDAA